MTSSSLFRLPRRPRSLETVAEHPDELLNLWREYNRARIALLTVKAYDEAIEAGRQAKLAPIAVVRAAVHQLHFGSSLGLSLELHNGADLTIPAECIHEIGTQSAKELARVKGDGFGAGLLWPSIDVAISVPGLLEDFFGYATRANVGRAGGRARTPAKASAARENGRKGGRPKRSAA